jgi:hypothetical protein
VIIAIIYILYTVYYCQQLTMLRHVSVLSCRQDISRSLKAIRYILQFSSSPEISKCPVDHKASAPVDKETTNNPSTPTGKPFDSIPGPPIYPIIGSVWDLKTRMDKGRCFFEVIKDYRNEYGPIVKAKIFNSPSVFLHDPREFLKGMHLLHIWKALYFK